MTDYMIHGDALCFVWSPRRTKETVDRVLNKFIPGHKKIDGDYAFSLTNDLTFDNEEGILKHLENTETESGTIHWQGSDNQDKVTVGAYFTSDGQLILSLTVSADGTREEKYLKELKDILGSKIGVIFYNHFPEFKNGEDFKKRYGLQKG